MEVVGTSPGPEDSRLKTTDSTSVPVEATEVKGEEEVTATGHGDESSKLSREQEEARLRFQMELEFVQCLANPWYLNFLAQNGYFRDPAFINFLKYLQYWKASPYVNYIIYPHCLHFLDLLQEEAFRASLAKNETSTFIHEKQFYHWQYYRNQPMTHMTDLPKPSSSTAVKPEKREAG